VRRFVLLTVAAFMAICAVAYAVNNTVSYTAKVTYKGKPTKTKPANTAYEGILHVATDQPGQQPESAPTTAIYYAKAYKNNAKYSPFCNKSEIDGQAVFPAKCKKAIVGTGTADATAGTAGGTGGSQQHLTVTAVNGPKGKSLYLVLNNKPGSVTVQNRVIPGTVVKSSGAFGFLVRFAVPQELQNVAGLDIALTDFDVKISGTPRTVVGAFPDLVSSGQAVAQITRRGLTPAVLELLDRACLEAVEEWKHLGIDADAAALLLARVDTPGDSGAAEASAIAATMTAAGALWAEQSTDDAEAEALFDARRLAYPALERLGPVLTEDVCVPRSQVPAMLEQISTIAARHGVRTATVAHAGDGNLHPCLITPPGDSAAREAAQAAFEEFLDAAIALGGTVTGEHGVGILKRDGMRRELDPGSLALQAAVRRALDPREIFNPGKG